MIILITMCFFRDQRQFFELTLLATALKGVIKAVFITQN